MAWFLTAGGDVTVGCESSKLARSSEVVVEVVVVLDSGFLIVVHSAALFVGLVDRWLERSWSICPLKVASE
jgi:hypothetical protein